MGKNTAPGPRKRLRRSEWILTSLFLLGGVFVVVNVTLFDIQVDTTPERRFSLSDTTEELLASFEEPVRIRYYVSEELREMSDEPEQTERLLRRYELLGGANVSVEIIDAGSEGGEAAESAGLRGEEIQVPGQSGGSETTVYSGLTVSYLGQERTIPFLFAHEQLEYQLSNALFDVRQSPPPRVTVMLGTEGEAFDVDYAELRNELSDRFDVTALEAGDSEVPADTDALLLLGTRTFTEQQANAVRSYLDEGGKALVAGDGLRVNLSTLDSEPVREASRSALDEVLGTAGMTIEPLALMDSRNNELVTEGGMSGVSYPPWIVADSRNADPDHPVTVGMGDLDLYWPSPLRVDTPEDGRNGPLVVTTGDAWLQGEPMNLQPDNRAALERNREQSLASYVLAAWAEDTHSEDSRLVVVSDSDFASNLVFYTESFANFMFVERSLLWLLGEDDMAGIHVRSRQPAGLDRIESPDARVVTAWLVGSVNTVLIPSVILLSGFLRLKRRRKRDQREADS
ncbi:MAG: Gldg family protein [Spirochaetales bacterium]